MMGATFAHLHTHSEYSPLDGLGKLPDLVAQAAADGNPAIAVTDHGTLAGAWKLDTLARQAGIKPIIGMEAYLAFGSRHEHQSGEVDPDDGDGEDTERDGKTGRKAKAYMHLTLLAATAEGWGNLVQIANAAQDSYWHKPRIDYELLSQHAGGLIVLTGCLGGPLAYHLNRAALCEARGEASEARQLKETARWHLRKIIAAAGRDNTFIEVMDHAIAGQERVTGLLRELAASERVQMVATNDAHYVQAADALAHEAWLAVSSRKALDDPKRFRFHGRGHHLRTEAEMRALHDEEWWQQACDATAAIAARIHDRVLPEPRVRLPRFAVPHGAGTAGAYLGRLVRSGAIGRYAPASTSTAARARDVLPARVRSRLRGELDVIGELGFADYFLIVAEAIAWARSRGIRVGPGRGSAAGSAVSYSLKITGIEPIRHGLLFERFLDVTRGELPDIDVDLEKARRGEVLAHLAELWGAENVAQLGTFGICRTRNAIKDAARVLGLNPLGARLSALVPAEGGKPAPVPELLESQDPAGAPFREELQSAGHDGARIMQLARAFENTTRQPGVHACGIVLSDEPLTHLIPLRANRSKSAEPGAPRITEWDGEDITSYGLVKMDFLGLRNLDVIARCAELIGQSTGELIDPDRLDPDHPADPVRDQATWAMLQAGKTAGVFQLDSPGMTRLCVQVAPASIDDLGALIALFRPGPLAGGMHERYAERKNGREEATYGYLTSDPAEAAIIGSVLGPTYATIVYQEQLMQLGEVVAGFDPALKSRLRRAVSKKKASEIAAIKDLWIEGGTSTRRHDGTGKLAFSRETLERLWDTFEGSAAYLFNKSHSAAYAAVAYQTAYLKANWPAEYAAALLAVTSGDGKRQLTLADAAAEGIAVLPPDVNQGQIEASCQDGHVRLGLAEIKGVGHQAASAIVAGRSPGGPYRSLADLAARTQLPAGTLVSLIEAGACDGFGPRLGQVMTTRAVRALTAAGLPSPVPEAEWGPLERAARQREKIGCITGPHPASDLARELAGWRFPGRDVKLLPAHRLDGLPDGAKACAAGLVTGYSERSYSRGQMATFTIEGSKGSVRCVAFDGALRALRHEDPAGLRDGWLAAADGKVSVRERIIEDEGEDGDIVTRVETTTELVVFEAHRIRAGEDAAITLEPPQGDVLAGLDVISAEPEIAGMLGEMAAMPDPATDPPFPPLPAPPSPHPSPAPAALPTGAHAGLANPPQAASSLATLPDEAQPQPLTEAASEPVLWPDSPPSGQPLPVLLARAGQFTSIYDAVPVDGGPGVITLAKRIRPLARPPARWGAGPGQWLVTSADGQDSVIVVLASGDEFPDLVTGVRPPDTSPAMALDREPGWSWAGPE